VAPALGKKIDAAPTPAALGQNRSKFIDNEVKKLFKTE
jgi:hypothetical protein